MAGSWRAPFLSWTTFTLLTRWEKGKRTSLGPFTAGPELDYEASPPYPVSHQSPHSNTNHIGTYISTQNWRRAYANCLISLESRKIPKQSRSSSFSGLLGSGIQGNPRHQVSRAKIWAAWCVSKLLKFKNFRLAIHIPLTPALSSPQLAKCSLEPDWLLRARQTKARTGGACPAPALRLQPLPTLLSLGLNPASFKSPELL